MKKLQPNDRDTIESIARADHEIITHALVSFRKLFHGERPENADRELASIQHLFKSKIAEHFACEDNDLFPALLAKHPEATTAVLIAELKQEHVQMLDELCIVNTLVGKRKLNKLTGEVWVAMLHFFNHLQNHMDKEVRLLAEIK